jgi:hypothetical protein
MPADSQGNNIAAVGVPITGFLGYAPKGTTLPTPAEGGAVDFVLPAAFKKLGLIKEDGGFEWTLEADGDPIKFFQSGYSIPSGLANATLATTLAQYDALVREVAWGKVADENGYITIDAGGHSKEFVIFSEEIFKSGAIRRRVAEASVTTAKVDKAENGSVNGTALTFAANRIPALNNEHIGEWWISAEDALAA